MNTTTNLISRMYAAGPDRETIERRHDLREYFDKDARGVELASFEEALAVAVEAAGLESGDDPGRKSWNFEWAFAVGCDLYARSAYGSVFAVEFPNGSKTSEATVTFQSEITWSSTGRDFAAAHQCLELYRQVVAKMAVLEALMGGKRYLTTKGWERVEEAALEEVSE
jgi:hypothetical protein